MAATNRAVQSLNYPTKVVFKSSKPAVVMLYSALFLKKTYGLQDYSAVLLMVSGLALFVLGDSTVASTQQSMEFDPLGPGVPLVSLALVIDAGIGPVQEYCLRVFGTPKAALVGYAYMGGFAINLVTAGFSGDLQGAWTFLQEQAAAEVEGEGGAGVLGMATPVLLVMLLSTISYFGVSLIVSSASASLRVASSHRPSSAFCLDSSCII